MIELKSDGLIEKIRTFLESNNNAQLKKTLLEKHIKDLQITDPKDLIKVLDELNNS